jgi:hypothetical protein
MARKDKAPAPVLDVEEVKAAESAPKYDTNMVNIRSVSGGVMIDPYTLIRFEGEPQRVLITSWVQCQLDAGKLEVVEG